jgi:hypothetical protein
MLITAGDWTVYNMTAAYGWQVEYRQRLSAAAAAAAAAI